MGWVQPYIHEKIFHQLLLRLQMASVAFLHRLKVGSESARRLEGRGAVE